MPNTMDKKFLISSIYIEKITPKKTPVTVAKKPIVKPVKKNDFIIDLSDNPRVLIIAISFVLFFIKIVKPEMILNAATIIISYKIINMTFLSTFRAEKRGLFKSDQV